ncbi:MAG: hypothetical protein EOP67_25145, partial [Sphingomonas sp.]
MSCVKRSRSPPRRTHRARPTAKPARHRHRGSPISPRPPSPGRHRAAVIGHYHSHPSGLPIPSPRDAAQAMGDGAIWVILGGGVARAWRSVEL